MLVRGPDPLETLPRSIRRPPLFKLGRWVACPLSESAKPGATRLEVILWLPVGDGGDRPGWDDVAVALGLTRGHVDVLVHRAKGALRVCMRHGDPTRPGV